MICEKCKAAVWQIQAERDQALADLAAAGGVDVAKRLAKLERENAELAKLADKDETKAVYMRARAAERELNRLRAGQ